MQTKICGLSTPETLDAAIAGGASHVGFVFYPPSPRSLSLDKAGALAARVPPYIKIVGVFVDPDRELLNKAIHWAELDAIQLHGTESPEKTDDFRRFGGVETWKAVSIKTRADLQLVTAYRGAADRIVYDAKTPPGALPGGMGMRFDWTLLDGFDHPAPWALSGGLTPESVREAVVMTGAQMVDVSSGVESAHGIKDVDKIARFLQAVAAL